MQCPICRNSTSKITIYDIEIDSCSNCVGAWFDPNELADYLEKSTKGKTIRTPKGISQNQLRVKTQIRESGFCPKCNQLITPFALGSSGVSVLKCVRCGGMWVQLSQMSALRYWYNQAGPTERLMICGGPRQTEDTLSTGNIFKSLLGLIEDQNPRKHFPLITLLVILLNIVVFIWSSFSPDRARFLLMIPRDVLNDPSDNIHTLFTSMFMHANLIHLLGNMYFLWIFGDNIEDRVGMVKYALIYLSGGIFAGLAYGLFTSHPEIPVLGASGAVSGILGGYLLLYPRARIKIFTLIYFYPITLNLPIWFYLGLWFFGLQVLNASLGVPGVAWIAHIGGFVFGYLVLLVMRESNWL